MTTRNLLCTWKYGLIAYQFYHMLLTLHHWEAATFLMLLKHSLQKFLHK